MAALEVLQIFKTRFFAFVFYWTLVFITWQEPAGSREIPTQIVHNVKGALKYVSTTRLRHVPLEVRALCLSEPISLALKHVYQNFTVIMEAGCPRPEDLLIILLNALVGGYRSFVVLCEEPFAKTMALVLNGQFELASVATFVVLNTAEFQAGVCTVFKPLRNSFVSVTRDSFFPCSYEETTYCPSNQWSFLQGKDIVVGCGFIDSSACDKPSGRAILNALGVINVTATKKHPRGTMSLIESGIDVSLSFGPFHYSSILTSAFPTSMQVTELWYVFAMRPDLGPYNTNLSPRNLAFGSVLLRLCFISGASWVVILFLQLLHDLPRKDVSRRTVFRPNFYTLGYRNIIPSNKAHYHIVGFSWISWAVGSLFLLFYAQCLITSTAIVPLKREVIFKRHDIEALFDRNPACICTDFDTFLYFSHHNDKLTPSIRFTLHENSSCQTPDLPILPNCLEGVRYGRSLAIVSKEVKCDLEHRFGIDAALSDEPVATIFENTPVRRGFRHAKSYAALVRRMFETGWFTHEYSLHKPDSCVQSYHERPFYALLAAAVLISGSILAACICILEHILRNHTTLREVA